ncbi:MAG: hypothetical protein IJ680_05205, partial [Paludibacteraceae bacterium]|nr:hypothetical protein [Paludibacteraceae bacterium]
PAIVLVYYFHKFRPTFKGFLLAMVASAVILAVVLYGIIPGFVLVAGWFELFFVNTLRMPFNTGLFIYIILAIGLLVWTIYETHTHKSYWRSHIAFILSVTASGIPFFGGHVLLGILIIALMFGLAYWCWDKKKTWLSPRLLNTMTLMIATILIGYSSYAVIVIRSASDPSMDQNSPDNVFALKSYLNREQYGDRPLLYGPSYTADYAYEEFRENGQSGWRVKVNVGEPQYAPKIKTDPNEKDSFVVASRKRTYEMVSGFNMLFPRMYSTQGSHQKAYEEWAGAPKKTVRYEIAGQKRQGKTPTFGQNLKFFVSYQCHFMYWRYFMWNFAGRQNDLQGYGELDKGNWLSGISFIDNARLGDQSKLPDSLKQNKGHNVYYMLPLLLGLLGICFQLSKGARGKQSFIITLLLFFMTGLAIVVYLNQTPYQPRERDYAYAGSFYAFCIWIGIGVLFIDELLQRTRMPRWAAAAIAGIASLGVPALMAQQNWDDHDRSGRYVARDFGHNYLASLRKNAIIFTNGDNDTFPLWYNQGVEGDGTDARVCNLSYLQTDWYIDQMKRPYYQSDSLPISWTPQQYAAGTNEYVAIEDRIPYPISVKDAYAWLNSENEITKLNGENFLPASRLYVDVDGEDVMNSPAFAIEGEDGRTQCRYTPEELDRTVDISLTGKRGISRSEMMVLEMLSTNRWKRPMYFAVTVGDDYYQSLEPYFELTGLAYQITPVRSANNQPRINVDEMYENMMHKFRFGNVSQPGIYLDENVIRMCRTHRMMFLQLAEELVRRGEPAKATEVLDKCMKELPMTNIPVDYSCLQLANIYLQAGQDNADKAEQILLEVCKDASQYVEWISSLKSDQRKTLERTFETQR